MNSIFLDTLKNKVTPRPPIWFMRQAGRILPDYQRLRKKYTFSELMQDPDLASEVTLLPINSLGVDAVILFSDILVVPEALGMKLEFTDKGPIFHDPIDINKPNRSFKKNMSMLNYIYRNINKIKQKNSTIPLIGFCGGPLTVFCFMFKGDTKQKNFNKAIKFLYKYPEESHRILNLITEVSEYYVDEQINHGIDCFQLFETYCGLIPNDKYYSEILPYSKRILNRTKNKVPSIFFPKDYSMRLDVFNKSYCDFVSLDWSVNLLSARKVLDKNLGIQGNIDPRLLYSDYNVIEKELKKLKSYNFQKNWIINLGHGFLPDIDYKKAKFIVEWVKKTNWNK